jgi:hypothetical protein
MNRSYSVFASFLILTGLGSLAPMQAEPKISAIAQHGSNLYVSVFQYDPPGHLSSYLFVINNNSKRSIPLPPYLTQYQIRAILPVEEKLLVIGEWSVEGPLPLRIAVLDAKLKWTSFGQVDCPFFNGLSQGPSQSVRVQCTTEAGVQLLRQVRKLQMQIPAQQFPQLVAGEGEARVVVQDETIHFPDGRTITVQTLINGIGKK